MKKFISFIMVVTLFIVCLLSGIKIVTECVDTGYRVSAYVPVNGDLDVENLKLENVTNVYIAFATLDEEYKATLEADWAETDEKAKETKEKTSEKIKELRDKYPEIKMSIAIGGYKAEGFSDMAMDSDKRDVFIKSAIKIVEEYKLDGIDIDWEFPVSGGNGSIKSRPEDKQNFTVLMKELRKALDELSSENIKQYELTFAQTALKEGLENIEIEEVESVIDAINLMAYDYTGEWSKITAHNANLYTYGEYENQINTSDIINEYEKRGINLKKIVLGVPAYGYGWNGVFDENHGLHQSAKEGIGAIPYKEIKSKYLDKDGFNKYFDDNAKVPYLYNGDIFITYEDKNSAVIKAQYIREKKLGGAMIWEYTQDDNGEITKSIYGVLKRK